MQVLGYLFLFDSIYLSFYLSIYSIFISLGQVLGYKRAVRKIIHYLYRNPQLMLLGLKDDLTMCNILKGENKGGGIKRWGFAYFRK